MPGPYTTADEVLAQVQGRLNLAADAPPPEHWQGLVTGAIRRGYADLLTWLGRSGYSVAAVDQWPLAADYNRDLAVARVFLGSRYAQESLGEAARLDLEQLEHQLGDPDNPPVLFDAGGAVIPPSAAGGGAAGGRNPAVEADLAAIDGW